MKKRIGIILALAAVLVFVCSGAVFAAPPAGTKISNDLEDETEASEYTCPQLAISGLAAQSGAGLYDEFTLTITSNSERGKQVYLKITRNDEGFNLAYNGSLLTFTDDVAETGIFALPASGTLEAPFAVKWLGAGTYNLTFELVNHKGKTLATLDTSVTVLDPGDEHVTLTWKDGMAPAGHVFLEQEDQIGFHVNLNGITSIDNCVYVIELHHDMQVPVADADFDIVAINGDSAHLDLAALNGTFSDDSGIGYWGGSEGFDLTDTDVTMTFKFHEAENYNYKIYVMQLLNGLF